MSEVKVVKDGGLFFVEIDGVRIARRGYPGTPQAGTWVSIEPGWEVLDGKDPETIAIKYNGFTIQ